MGDGNITMKQAPAMVTLFPQEKVHQYLEVLEKLVYSTKDAEMDRLGSKALDLVDKLSKPQTKEDAKSLHAKLLDTIKEMKAKYEAVRAGREAQPLEPPAPAEMPMMRQVFPRKLVPPKLLKNPLQPIKTAETTFEHGGYSFTVVDKTLRTVKSKIEGWEVRDDKDNIHTIVTTADGKHARFETTDAKDIVLKDAKDIGIVGVEDLGIAYHNIEGNLEESEIKRICKAARKASKLPSVKVRLMELGVL